MIIYNNTPEPNGSGVLLYVVLLELNGNLSVRVTCGQRTIL